MKVLITNNRHSYYDRVGDIVSRQDSGWMVMIKEKEDVVLTYVDEQDFKPTPEIKSAAVS